MKLFVRFVVGLIPFVSCLAGATTPADRLSVKITSYDSDAPSAVFQGSGTLFMRNGVVYALTSEHVVLHKKNGNRITLRNAVLGNLRGSLVAADYSVGLALVRVEGAETSVIPSLSDLLAAAPVRHQDAVLLAGFAFNSPTLLKDSGKVIDPASERHLIPGVAALIETTDANGEYGMSGSSVWSSDGQKILGLLSHQFLRMSTQSPVPQISEFERGSAALENHLLTIPAATISAWVGRVLADPSACVHAVRDPRLQIRGSDAVLVDGYRLIVGEHKHEGAIGGKEGGRDGHGIGGDGRDGHGIGGKEGGRDGHGIGGTQSISDGEMLIVQALRAGDSAGWTLCRSPSISTRLQGLSSIESFIAYDPERLTLDPQSVRSLAQAVHRLWSSRQIPVPASGVTAASGLDASELQAFSDSVQFLQSRLAASTAGDLGRAQAVRYPALVQKLAAVAGLARTEVGLRTLRVEGIVHEIRADEVGGALLFKDDWERASRIWEFLEKITPTQD